MAYDRCHRPCCGHDLRYAIDSTKLREELGWGITIPTSKQVWKTLSSGIQTTKIGGRLKKEAVEANYAKTQKFWNKEEKSK